VAALVMAAVPAAGTGAEPGRPNILFIMSDDHAYQAISAYGSNRNKTPNIDRLAKEGMRFDRCFVTNSICGPSRAVILTGKYSHLNGFPDNSAQAWFNGQQQTAPKLLQAAGYQTAVIGKWHLNSDPVGFDYCGRKKGTFYFCASLRGRPGGRRVDSSPNWRAARLVQMSLPKGVPR
jgi:arylsulfatase A-like enzyme